MIGFNKLWGVNLISRFPGVVCFRISYPLDQVLEGSSLTGVSMIDNPFDFIFFFSFDKVRRWPRIVRPVCICFMIGG